MSFKREGDDLSLLNKLKHQRVSELLGSHIPEDEAKILSNGRLTCLICSFRPIFDTIAVLAKHRQGKKHILELSRHIKREQELELENAKKVQKQSLKDEAIEMSLKSKMLGAKESCNFESSPAYRKKIIDIPKLTVGPHLTSVIQKPSPSSQLRRYLKKIHRKPSLGKLLEEKKDGYLEREKVNVEKEEQAESSKDKLKTKSTELDQKESVQENEDFSKNLSGWIKNKDGTWSKDPNAEFDSDDEEPPENEVKPE